MSSILEEKLREAACVGDSEALLALLCQNIDVNSKNHVNGWTALHWAAKRGHEHILRLLINHGADPTIENHKGETPAQVSCNNTIIGLFDSIENDVKFLPNYVKNAPINGQVDISKSRPKHDFSGMKTTVLPAGDDLVLNIRICGSHDPDFIQIEIPRWKLTYSTLLKICCEELDVLDTQIERIRKLPNVRLRNDNDVKRLNHFQYLEIVLKAPPINGGDKTTNCYQSISTCKDQTILY